MPEDLYGVAKLCGGLKLMSSMEKAAGHAWGIRAEETEVVRAVGYRRQGLRSIEMTTYSTFV